MAGLVAAFALPGAALGLALPFPVALGIGVVIYAGLALLLAPRRAAERIASGQVGRVQTELVAGLIEEGEAAIGRLRGAAQALRRGEASQTVAHLAATAQGIIDRLAAEPGKLPPVRRFLTYYLPRSAEIAEGLGIVEGQHQPDPRRQATIAATLGKLDRAFTFYADSLAEVDLDRLDSELKLLGRALDEDLAAPVAQPQREG